MKKYLFILVPALMFVYSCKHARLVDAEFINTPFPLKVGNWWRYRVTDTTVSTTRLDTLTFSIVSVSKSGDTSNYIGELKISGAVVGSGLYSISTNQLQYKQLYSNYVNFIPFIIKPPFKEGELWTEPYPFGTYYPEGKLESYNVLGKSYSPVYFLRHKIQALNYYHEENLFITPEVGIINQSSFSYDYFRQID